MDSTPGIRLIGGSSDFSPESDGSKNSLSNPSEFCRCAICDRKRVFQWFPYLSSWAGLEVLAVRQVS